MKLLSIVNSLFFIIFLSCDTNSNYKDGYKNSILYNLVLIDALANQNDKFTFQNYRFSYSSMISRNINSSNYSICVDIFKNVTLDGNKIITGYEGSEMPNRCHTYIPIQFRCIKDVLLVIEVQNFPNEVNTSLRDYCKDTLNGVIAY
ncbi:hypothetical protein ND861_06895 [Leptospira sp. 2 VSF19]|uniref:Lipoprotein n=1 Tax=Leptospira soteropolitanensis TaxID=2950025 RepID=A0ABT3MGP0_9LEPT|nr:hypothetical protein [Leptospira soteropolitanensis]MCW7492378.1 hypothetical protein [Leptospira soteropolitanensis]MCW7522210.1 hypothetical protein [Leptospira soteropolitanensis]MCW7526065.1 hypothetical protein [Leptospira soteropolitanensis]